MVIGFASTTLIESLAANRPIISPDFRTVISDKKVDFFTNFLNLVNYAHSMSELEEYIENVGDYLPNNEKSRNEFLELMIYKTDGMSSKRAEKEIINTIKSK